MPWPIASAPNMVSPCRRAPPDSTSRSCSWESVAATRSSFPPCPSSRPPTWSATRAQPPCSPMSSSRPGTSSAATIEPLLGPSTRAVILVHQGGVPADVEGAHALCDPRGVAVIEDAACAIGSTIDDVPIGGHSDLVVFSFHPRKVITTGEGGMVMTSSADWAARLRRLREHGMSVSAAGPPREHDAGARAVPRARLQLSHDGHPGRSGARAAHSPRRDRCASAGSRRPVPRVAVWCRGHDSRR